MPYTTINKGSSYFNTVLYAGNDTGQSITTGIANDFVWIKDRGGTDGHTLFDVIRTPLQRVITNVSDAESTLAGSLTAFNSNGFTVGNSDNVNDIGHNFVSWNWLAGGAGVSNTSGTISSTVSVNQTAGFSIVSYTGNGSNGATIGHGLGATPSFLIVKNRTAAESWQIYSSAISGMASGYLQFNTTGFTSGNTTVWSGTSPTSSVFSVGTNGVTNTNTQNYIAYCFAAIKGYSKFGSYTGNASANGTFIYTGFKPAFILIKRTDSTADWYLQDNVRNQNFNGDPKTLQPNNNSTEGTIGTWSIDNLSNGFKIRESNAAINASGGTYIYMALAQNPFVTSGGIPVTAR
jgi:hypothetical protein